LFVRNNCSEGTAVEKEQLLGKNTCWEGKAVGKETLLRENN
jgi:hypothetical protein